MNKIKEMKYKIYHIKGVKIGVTQNVKQRIRYYKEVMLSDVEVLEEHTDIYKVSDREMELQKEYGYKVDCLPYWKTLKNHTKEGKRKGGKSNIESGHMQRMRELSNIATRIPVLQYTKCGKFIKEWISQREASKELNLHTSNINNVLKGNNKTTGGFVFKYAKELTC